MHTHTHTHTPTDKFVVSEMTYTVSSGTLNSSIPYPQTGPITIRCATASAQYNKP